MKILARLDAVSYAPISRCGGAAIQDFKHKLNGSIHEIFELALGPDTVILGRQTQI